MKELFSYKTFTNTEREILDSAQDLIAYGKKAGNNLAVRQVYYALINNNVINEKDLSFSFFFKLLKQGLFGGVIDWSGLVPDCEPYLALEDQLGPVNELWVRGAYLDQWLKNRLNVRAQTVVHTSGLTWSPFQLYAAMQRIYIRFSRGVKIDYLTDDFAHAKSMYEKFKKKLSRMLQIRIARIEFNKDKGELWLPEGMKMPSTGKGAGLRREASNYLKKAKEQINDLVCFNYLGLTNSIRMQGRLASLPVGDLDSLIFSGNVQLAERHTV